MAEVVTHLIYALFGLGIYFLTEQPLNSLLYHWPSVEAALAFVGAKRLCLRLSDFGGSYAKPTELIGTAPWLMTLKRMAEFMVVPNSELVRTLTYDVENGVTGHKDELKASPEWPVEFCKCIARLHVKFMNSGPASLASFETVRQGVLA